MLETVEKSELGNERQTESAFQNISFSTFLKLKEMLYHR